MAFGNKGGGCRTGPKYRGQVTAGMTDEHMRFLRHYSRTNMTTLADALRVCVERCMAEQKDPAQRELAGQVCNREETLSGISGVSR